MIVARTIVSYAGRQPSKITLGRVPQRSLGDIDLSAIAQYAGDVSSTAMIAVPGLVAYLVYQATGDRTAAAQAQITARNYMQSTGPSWGVAGLMSAVYSGLQQIGSAAADAFGKFIGAVGDLSGKLASIMTAMQLGGLALGGYLLYSLMSD